MATWQVWHLAEGITYQGDKELFPQTVFSYHAKNSMTALNRIRKWLRKEAERTKDYGYYRYNQEEAFSISLASKEDIDADDLHNEYFED